MSPKPIRACQEEFEALLSELFPDEPEDGEAADPGTPTGLSDAEVLRKCRQGERGVAFARLWGGDLSDYLDRNGKPNESSADLGLCNALRFYSGDRDQVEQLWGRSALGKRAKWQREDYRQKTLNRAMQGEVWEAPLEIDDDGIESIDSVPTIGTESPSTNGHTNGHAAAAVAARAVFGNGGDDDGEGPPNPQPGLDGYPLTDLGDAERLLEAFGDRLRFVEAWKRWIVWDGHQWHIDVAGVRAKRLCKLVIRRAGILAQKALKADPTSKAAKALRNHARRGERRGTESAMLDKASAFARVWVSHESLDAAPDLLNVANGIVNLRTGARESHDSGALQTLLDPVDYDPAAPCSLWEQTIAAVTETAEGVADPAYAHWLQKLFGYAATGHVREQVLPFLHGDGSNGKNTIIETIADTLGPYASPAPRHFLMLRTHDEHLTEIADLYRRRLVYVDETKHGGRLDEDKVKLLTGSKRLKARRMREDAWSFDATHTIVVLGNHKPEIRGDDYAIWRRVKLGPFDPKFVFPHEPTPEGQKRRIKDTGLAAKLEAERAGILAWIVRGAVAWYREGLAPFPARVETASEQYRAEQDVLGRFFADRCVFGSRLEVYVTPLYGAYGDWLESEGLPAESRPVFSERMSNRGYRAVAGTGNRQKYKQLALRDTADRTPPEAPTTPPEAPESYPSGRPVPDSKVKSVNLTPIDRPPRARAGKPTNRSQVNPLNSTRSEAPVEGASPAPALELPPHVVYVRDATVLAAELPALLAAPVVGVDCETARAPDDSDGAAKTALDPLRGRVRLIQLAVVGRTLVVDATTVDVGLLRPLFEGEGPRLVCHNWSFDLPMLAAAGLPMPSGRRLFCTQLAAMVADSGVHLHTKGYFTLESLVGRILGSELCKDEQTSDWSAPALSGAQLAYAARDSEILLPLAAGLEATLSDRQLTTAAAVEFRCLPAMAWLGLTGAPFDAAHWSGLATAAEAELPGRRDAIRAHAEALGEGWLDVVVPYTAAQLAPTKTGRPRKLPERVFNPGSRDQVLRLLRAYGVDVADAEEKTLAPYAAESPVVADVLALKTVAKLASTYGAAYLEHVHPVTGRLHPDYYQLGSDAGRMSCSRPNVQQIPKGSTYRKAFRAPAGRVLVTADYSQIEVCVAAELSGDEKMLAALRAGEDLHQLTASALYGVPAAAVTKEQRAFAKNMVFGTIFGQGVRGLRAQATAHGIALDDAGAKAFLSKFDAAWPRLATWRRSKMRADTEIVRTATGRRRLLNGLADERKAPARVNTPVQGTAADGLKLGLAELWATRGRCPSGAPVLVVHDEIVVECDAGDAAAAEAWVRDAMVAGMSRVLKRAPIRVSVAVAETWEK